ncbi:MAG: hypothetical protein K1X79_00500 [Oligoflexia bacterium]|nr:hypothetical protein [Oligoflexia bacterium]
MNQALADQLKETHMLEDLAISIDFVAALLTLAFIIKLLLERTPSQLHPKYRFEKRSLMNQRLYQRPSYALLRAR